MIKTPTIYYVIYIYIIYIHIIYILFMYRHTHSGACWPFHRDAYYVCMYIYMYKYIDV